MVELSEQMPRQKDKVAFAGLQARSLPRTVVSSAHLCSAMLEMAMLLHQTGAFAHLDPNRTRQSWGAGGKSLSQLE